MCVNQYLKINKRATSESFFVLSFTVQCAVGRLIIGVSGQRHMLIPETADRLMGEITDSGFQHANLAPLPRPNNSGLKIN